MRNLKGTWLLEILLLGVITAIVYLSQLGQLSYYRDDWTFAYDGYVGGSDIFSVKFSSDRPARGLYYVLDYALFGPDPLPYHLVGYFWRWLGAISALWLFNMMWQHHRFTNFSMGVLFAIYPGFLLWPAVIEYQVHIASVCLHILSIALTIKAVQAKIPAIIYLWIGSLILGTAAIFLVEYAIGMEVFRFLCVYLVTSHRDPDFSFLRKVKNTIQVSWISLAIPLGYLLWNLFLFQSERKLTDVGFHLHNFIDEPAQTGVIWIKNLWISIGNSFILTWWIPLKNNIDSLDQGERFYGYVSAIVCVILILVGYLFMPRQTPTTRASNREYSWQFEAIMIGCIGMILGLLPVIIADRYVAFRGYSHYGLPVSLAVVVLVVGLCSLIRLDKLLIAILVGISALTHYALAVNVVHEEQTIRNFWWQTYWRAPGIEKGTLLAVYYPKVFYGDDVGVVMGPANFLYYPDQTMDGKLVTYEIGAVELSKDNIEKIIEGNVKSSSQYRSHKVFLNYKKVLVLTQPSTSSCVHVLDADRAELSRYDNPEIASIIHRSDISLVTSNGRAHVPLKFVFGIEPEHDWCYFFEKADRARQQGNWTAVMNIGNQAVKLGLDPVDLIEWLPFLQAYAYLEDQEGLDKVISQIMEDPFYKIKACESIRSMNVNGFSIDPRMQRHIESKLCN